jgi:protein-S-isoprenylcysteine O-methyltransferase Ste14
MVGAVVSTREGRGRSERQRHQAQNLWDGLAVGVVLVFLAVDALLFARQGRGLGTPSYLTVPPVWSRTLHLSTAFGAMAIMIAVLVLALRDGGSHPVPKGLTRRGRKALLKQVRGKRALVPGDLPGALDLARALVGRRYMLLFGFAMALLEATQAFGSGLDGDRVSVVINEAVVVVMALVVIIQWWSLKVSRGFLDQHPDPSPTRAPRPSSGLHTL